MLLNQFREREFSPLKAFVSFKRLVIKRALSWLMASLGLVAGFLALALAGERWIPDPNTDPHWHKAGIQTAGGCLLGLTFIAGSLIAIRNRRRGGLIFLVCTPLVAFCIGYPDAGYLAWDNYGNGIFYSPFLRTALGLALLFFAPFVVPLFAIRNRKRVIYLFLLSVIVVSPVFVRSRWTSSLVPRLAGWSAPTFVLALFWVGTFRWEPLIAWRSTSLGRRVTSVVVTCLVVAALDIGTTLALTAWESSVNGPDCAGRQLFMQPVFPRHAVFTAHLVRVGHAAHATGNKKKWAGDWAIGVVEERFWGLPSVWPRFVLLTNSIFWEDERYFVDGSRPGGFLTRVLPIVQAGPCSRTRPLVDATVDLRILREKHKSTRPRIVGFVRRPETSRPWPSAPVAHTPFAGARILFAGSSGNVVAIADRDGIYEVEGLQPDNYKATLELPDTLTASEQVGREKTRQEIRKDEFDHQTVIERDFHVVWNGTIEGTVRDTSGHPIHVWVSLLRPDGTDTIAPMMGFQETHTSGTFHLARVPQGDYKLMVNPLGPNKDSPYPPMYYRSAARLPDAQVLKVGEGQHIKDADFVLPILTQKKMEVRVTWPDGRPVDGAWIYVAYEHTRGFDLLNDAAHVAITDHNGEASFSVFGKSRLRIYAEEALSDLKGPPFVSSRYSVPADFQADMVPEKLELGLTGKTLPTRAE
jgi:hypothetical protein